jgi:hypothetical protein
MCVMGIGLVSVSKNFPLDFGIVLTVYFLFCFNQKCSFFMSTMFDVISEPNKKYDWITFVIFFVDDTIYLIKTQGHYLIYLIFRKLFLF